MMMGSLSLSLNHLVIILLLTGFPIGHDAGNCCYYVNYDVNDIKVVSSVEKTDQRNVSIEWNLLANISWALPDTSQESYDIDRYAIDVEEFKSNDQLRTFDGSCNYCPLLPETDTITNSTWYVFGDLWFGTEYMFSIHFIRTQSIIYKGKFDFKTPFNTPDCFDATQGDGDFCQNQDVQISGIIIDLRLDDVFPEDDGYVTGIISWIPPVHVRKGSVLEAYTVTYQKLSEDTKTVLNLKAQNQSNWRERQVTELTGLKFNETYRFNIQPVVNTESSLLQNGISSNITFNTSIEFGEWTDWRAFGACSCDGFVNYSRVCQSQEWHCLGNAVEERTCEVSDECNKLPTAIIIAGVLIGLIVLVIVVFVHNKYGSHILYGASKSSDGSEQGVPFVDPAFKDHEIRCQTHVVWDEKKLIGNGRFGMVYSCPVINQDGHGHRKLVAIKTPLETASAAEKMDFKKEIQLMSQIGKHSNVIELIGCRTTKDPMYIITPLMKYGCLLELLRKSSKMKKEGVFTEALYDLKLKDLFSIGRQIAIGMEYISSLRIVHGDLAARNVLIGKGLVAKIGDFGLGQDVYEKGYLRLQDGEVPVKWYSMETLFEHFMTPMSDVWSFGILLYELFTFGKSPYPGIIIGTLPQLLQRGYRMQRPEQCPSTVYKIMRSCWHECPKKRPTFTMLYQQLDTILEFVTNDFALYITLSGTASRKCQIEDGKELETYMHDKMSKYEEFELDETKSNQSDRVNGTEANDEDESTGQTFSISEFIPMMETSSQYGDKSSGLAKSLSLYEFNSYSENTGFNSVQDVKFMPIFEDSGDNGPSP